MKQYNYGQRYSYNCLTQPRARNYVIARKWKTPHAKSTYRRSKKSSEQTAELQLPGFSHIICKGNSAKTRIFWALVCFVVVTGCTYQCSERVHYFFICKPAMNTKLVHKHTIPIPVIVACPCDEKFRNPSVDSSLLQDLYGNISYSTVYDLMDVTQMNIKTLWNISRLVTTTTAFTLTQGVTLATGFRHTSELVDVSEIFTTSGTCFLVRATSLTYRFIDFTYRFESGLRRLNEAVSYSTEEYVPLMKYFYPMQALFSPMNSVNLIILRMEEVHLLNSWSQPCKDGVSITKCLTECIEKAIFSKVPKPCRLPYMETSSTIPECSTSQEFRAIFNATDQVVQQFRPEQCKSCNIRQCKEIVYHLESFSQRHSKNSLFQVWVGIPENRFPSTQEENIYNLVALFSDIGGGLGFFLGICALQIIELIVIFGSMVLRKIHVH